MAFPDKITVLFGAVLLTAIAAYFALRCWRAEARVKRLEEDVRRLRRGK